MERRYISWASPSMGKEMEILILGSGGTPVILFPSAHGNFREWDNHGAFSILEEQIENGYNQFFCIDSFSECFLNNQTDTVSRMKRFNSFQNYMMDEVLPFITKENENPYVIAAGAALGACAALLFGLKYPLHFRKVIGLCGYYDIRVHTNHVIDDHVYFNNPAEFVPGITDQLLLKQIQNVNIRLLNYRNCSSLHESELFSNTLWQRKIDHDHYIWDNQTDDMWNLLPAMLKENLY